MFRNTLACAAGLAAFAVGSTALAYGDAEFIYPKYDTVPGTRARCHAGKLWPLAPRPGGPSEPIIHRYHTAHYWPDPYRWQDRTAYRTAFSVQKSVGWMTATTLYDQHFDAGTNELNKAGREHLRWILRHVPRHARSAWIQSGETAEVDAARLASVRAEAQVVAGHDLPSIQLRVCEPAGSSARLADIVQRAYESSVPPPRIPLPSQASGNGSGGSTTGSADGS
jgi:hypothetical protein